ncbi:hypothetical protein JNUCC0626_21295 [Lentzea sp. JNUCC 0626]|uniref:hypothetical protein n=1 Tax=Lentzea sp. JNUCC 0626 TaxID=3367513 RepID=UPI00374957B8
MESATLHTMARRYLMSRNEKLHAEQSAALRRAAGPGGTLTERLDPRCEVVAALLNEVEKLDPEDLPPLDQLVSALSTAATTAQSMFTTGLGPADAEASAGERALFRRSVKDWLRQDLVVEPLPYRRALGEDEALEWRRRIEARWGSPLDGMEWHPIIGPVPPDVLALDSDAVWEGPATELAQAALRDMGVRRVVEIREFAVTGYVLDLELFVPTNAGGPEGIWADDTMEWIAYASHEASVAFGGTLAERLRASWPDVADWTWVPYWEQPAR